MSKFMLFVVCCLLFVLTLPKSYAETSELIACHGCNAEKMKSVASEKFQLFGKNKDFIVVDSQNEKYVKYKIYNTMDANGDPIKIVTKKTPTIEESSAVNSIFSYKRKLVNSLSNSNLVRTSPDGYFEYILDYNIYVDPYEFAAHETIRRDVFDSLKNDYFFMPAQLSQKIFDFVEIPTGFHIGVILHVNFYSLSNTLLGSAKLIINPVYSGFTVLEILDEEKNAIPDNLSQIDAKSFRVRAGSHQDRFANYMLFRFGIRLVGTPESGFCYVTSTKQVGDRIYYQFKCN